MNGCDISSEAFGYPEAYFTPPAEALDKLEIVRGAASLQYGTQFGGLMNYVTKSQSETKHFLLKLNRLLEVLGCLTHIMLLEERLRSFLITDIYTTEAQTVGEKIVIIELPQDTHPCLMHSAQNFLPPLNSRAWII